MELKAAIVSAAEDLHALAVQHLLTERFGVDCALVAVDRFPASAGLTWALDKAVPATVPCSSGSSVHLSDVGVIWWRRPAAAPAIPAGIEDAGQRSLIENDCRAALIGTLLTEFTGRWVSDPAATRRAENKLLQLRVAREAGFRVPRTLVSQNPEAIREFCHAFRNQVVIKAVRGTTINPPLTTLVNPDLLEMPDSLRMCPAIYQEYIPGRQHLRVHVFGESIYAVQLESGLVDWRSDSTTPIRPVELPERTRERLRRVTSTLGLRMGIFDLKLAADGEPVWLEVNPQGQFLFVEGICGVPLTEALCRLLTEQISHVQATSGAAGCPEPRAAVRPGRW